MQFSLINISSHNDDKTINGFLIQDHVGTLESAIKLAEETEKVNSNKIEIAITEKVLGDFLSLTYYKNNLREVTK